MSDNSNNDGNQIADLSAKIDALVDADKEIFKRLERLEKSAAKQPKSDGRKERHPLVMP